MYIDKNLNRVGTLTGVLRSFLLAGLFMGCLGLCRVTAEDAAPTEPEKVWQEIMKAWQHPPVPPAEWATKSPSKEEVEKFRGEQQRMAMDLVRKLHDYYTKYPTDPKVEEAKGREQKMIRIAAQLGSEEARKQLAAQNQETAKPAEGAGNPLDTADDILFRTRWRALQEAVRSKEPEGMEAINQAIEKGIQQLIKDFPKRVELYKFLVDVANDASAEHAKELLKQVVNSPTLDEIKAAAREQLDRLESVGKPMNLKYADLKGRTVDIAGLKGKVVLVDFWATWCGPCLAELPELKSVYEKYHDQGFEIMGISLDHDKEALTNFLTQEKITWSQYFDGEGWNGTFPRQFGIHAIPNMMLVDKKGLLRELSARGNLEEKVKNLLAEGTEKVK